MAADLARSFRAPLRRYRSPLTLGKALDFKTGRSPALELIDRELVDLMRPSSPADALAVFMPPQEGKSQLVSRRFAEWVLDDNPRTRVAIVSYEEDTALRWGRDVKQDVMLHHCPDANSQDECERACGGLHIPIRRDSSAAGRWETRRGGGLYCVGVGGPLTGRPVDVLIIDDPVKDQAAAESAKIRDTAWKWWESVALMRLAPGARVVLIQTRWHEDDLAGRLASRPSPLNWKVLRIPAIADGPDDPLGRKPGEEMVSVRGRRPGHFLNLKANMSPYVFSSILQQKPVAPEGNFFRRATFRYWRQMEPWADGRERIFCEGKAVTLADCWAFITMDFAASTKTDADWTVAALWVVAPDGDLILMDLVRDQVEDHAHFGLAAPLLARLPVTAVYVEQNWWARTFVKDALDAGVPVAPVLADTDKVTRAVPAAGRVHAGRVYFPAEAAWMPAFTNELAIFPSGSNDDQVDVLSYAARVVTNEWTPARQPERPGLTPWEDAVNAASHSATGNGHHELDIMGTQW